MCRERFNTLFIKAHEYIILKELKKVETDQEDLSELLIKFTILHGQLMDVINSSRSEDGHKGKKISAIEKKKYLSHLNL